MNKNKKYILIVIALLVVLLSVIGIIVLAKSKKSTVQDNGETIPTASDELKTEDNTEPKEQEEKEPEVEEPTEEQPKQEDTKTDSNQASSQTSNNIKYYIKVNNKANVVTIYTKDENGDYTVPYKAMLCSIGTATPAAGNVYTIPNGKWDRWTWGQMVGGVWAQYYTRIKGSILFHSVPYTSKAKGTLEYWEYDKLGTKASAGCIRLTVQDAKWIYDNCKPGTKVEFYEDSNPGPLGKPTAQKISDDEEVRGWDPTDPDAENPWKNYVKPVTPTEPKEEPKVEPTTPTVPKEEPKVEPTTPTEPKEEPKEEPTTPTEPKEEPKVEPTTPTEPKEEPKVEPTTPTEPKEEPKEEPTTPTESKEEQKNDSETETTTSTESK